MYVRHAHACVKLTAQADGVRCALEQAQVHTHVALDFIPALCKKAQVPEPALHILKTTNNAPHMGWSMGISGVKCKCNIYISYSPHLMAKLLVTPLTLPAISTLSDVRQSFHSTCTIHASRNMSLWLCGRIGQYGELNVTGRNWRKIRSAARSAL